ncbi:Ripening-related protein 3 [Rhynchospora pubera]|uniref:Ripening-related protein 3 n=1 Tax=Rhynchospora pubera TaxID=906938 RepID=A0AAV8GD84_9POAL|nr:Ripening-related protein 3 [Rhynchospora pubera]
MPISTPPLNLFFATILITLSLPKLNQATVRIIIGRCHASGFIESKGGYCPVSNSADCCQAGQTYSQYHCSPPVTGSTAAIMYKTSFVNKTAKCDNRTYPDSDVVVALSTGWYDGGSRCMRNITIDANNGNSVTAQVVGECDSWNGCDVANGNAPPCVENVVMASPAVWEQLGVPQSQSNELDITWSDVS